MRSRASPISSARSADSSADCTMASRVHRARVDRIGRARVLVHQLGEQLLVERAPIGADAHRLAVLDRGLDDGAELPVLLFLEADIAGIDAVLVERLGAGRMVGQQLVADIVEVADDRHVDAHLEQPLLDVRHRRRRLVAVDGDAHDLGAGARERRHLPRGSLDVGGVGIGHRLHDDRRAAADHHAADIDGHRSASLLRPASVISWRSCVCAVESGRRDHRRSAQADTARNQSAASRGRFTSTSPPTTSTTAAAKAGVSGSPSTRCPAATPNSGVRKVNAESRLAE